MSTRLDSLPPEILFNILAFCEPNLNLNLTPYPLCTLAATNKHLCAIVEEYARGLLKKHVLKTKFPKNLTNRRKWLAEICQFCKKNSKRKAIIYPTLTCCRLCDRAQFPKMTMTDATQQHNLSKLDLFTPNILHPNLPPLAAGSYSVHGSSCTMLSAPDVLARRDHIHALLGSKANDAHYMGKRPNAHQRITAHSFLRLDTTDFSWVQTRPSTFVAPSHAKSMLPFGPRSMHTPETRKEYVKKALEKEWADMGVTNNGSSRDTAIELS